MCSKHQVDLPATPAQGQSAIRMVRYGALPILPRGALHRRPVLPLVWGAGAVGTVERRDHGDRADDLKLGVTVALKFLPRELRQDPSKHNRFLSEVRLARQISHPNVCRRSPPRLGGDGDDVGASTAHRGNLLAGTAGHPPT